MKMAEGCVVGGGRVIGTNVEKNKHSRDLLHPELLSRDFILLTLLEKKIPVDNEKYADKDRLTDLYLQHIIPLPQRDLPNSRWGKRMEKKRASQSAANAQRLSSGADGSRKRPILFDGSSTSTSIKLKKIEAGATDRLKPPPSGNLANTIRRLSNTSTNCSSDGSLSSAANNSIKHLPEMVVKQDRATTSYQNPNGNVKSTPASVTEASTGGTASMKLKKRRRKKETLKWRENLNHQRLRRKFSMLPGREFVADSNLSSKVTSTTLP